MISSLFAVTGTQIVGYFFLGFGIGAVIVVVGTIALVVSLSKNKRG